MENKKKNIKIGDFFKRYYKYIFLSFGIIGIVAMVISSDLQHIDWSLFATSNFLFLLLGCFGVWAVIYLLHTLTYRIILKEESKKIDSFHLFKITMTGFALNNVTPAGLIGGEPYRIMELKKYVSTEKSASATFSFTILYAAGHLLLWDAGFITYLIMGLPGSTTVDILLIATGVFNILATFCLIFLRVNIVYPFMRFITKLPLIGKKLEKSVEKKKDTYIEIDQLINEFRRDWFRFIFVLAIQFVTRLLEALEYFLIIRFFLQGSESNFNYFHGLMVMATCSLIGNLVFVIPMQAGSREGGMAIALNFLFEENVVSRIAIPVGIVYRFRELFCTFIGIIMVASTRRYESHKQKVKLESNKVENQPSNETIVESEENINKE